MIIYDWYYIALGIILIPGLILAVWAQIKVNSSFEKYDKQPSELNIPANKLARQLLDASNLSDIKVTSCSGTLTDHYNPKTKTVSLSDTVYSNNSISALAVMAHELGHVLQYRDNYFLIRLRTILIPIINISNFFVWPLVIIGIIIEALSYTSVGFILIVIGIVIFALSTLLSLITIPIERDASSRAYTMLVKANFISKEDGKGVKAVLNSACFTYVAGLVTSILSLLRFILYIFAIRGNRN